MSPSHDRIGPTAHYTAYVWRRLRLPHADVFATRTGAALYWGFFAAGEWTTRLSRRVPSMSAYLEYRHRLIEAVVADHDPDLLVELGAGLSRRGVTWAAEHGTRVVEIDLPHMVEAKRRALARPGTQALRAALEGRHALEEGDVLSPVFGERLSDLLGDAARPVVVAEGLLSYFDPADRARVFGSVAGALHGRGAFICDLHTVDAQAEVGQAAAVLRFAIRTLTRRRQALDPYRTRGELLEAMHAAGFAHARAVDAHAYLCDQPRLAHVHSPAHVVVAG